MQNVLEKRALESRVSTAYLSSVGVNIVESKPEVAKVDLLQVILQHQISELRLLHQEGAIILMRHLNDNIDRGDDDNNEAIAR